MKRIAMKMMAGDLIFLLLLLMIMIMILFFGVDVDCQWFQFLYWGKVGSYVISGVEWMGLRVGVWAKKEG